MSHLSGNALDSYYGRILPALLIFGLMACPADAAEDTKLPPPRISVDSTFPGYNPAVLTDGKWFEKGKEDPGDYTANRLGNGGNTWLSQEGATEHWIRMDWAQPVTLDELVVWWSLAEWYPRAFRVEQLQDEKWIPVGEDQGWLAAIDRQSVIPLPSIRTQSLRLLMPGNGGNARAMLAAQEIIAFSRDGKSRPMSGTRRLAAAAYARLTPKPLAKNIARLEEEYPGAAFPMIWSADGKTTRLAAIVDGNNETVAANLTQGMAAGIEWPVGHVIESASAVFNQAAPEAATLKLEMHDGQRWIPVSKGLKCRTIIEQRRIEWTFTPVATQAFRISVLNNGKPASITEMEVNRSLPANKTTWPERFAAKEGLKQELLAADEEPSFESLAVQTLSMRTARALMGLKDTRREVGAGWEGTLEGRSRIEFRFGAEQYRLAEFPDTVQRELIDGWRPGVVIQARVNDLDIQETAFVSPLKDKSSAGVLLVRFDVRNLSNQAKKTWIEAEILSERIGNVRCEDGLLMRDRNIELISISPSRAGDSTNAMCVDLDLAPGQEQSVVFMEPQDAVDNLAKIAAYRSIVFNDAMKDFRTYWDAILADATAAFDVPEARINRTVKAVLAQTFINGDGNVMPYGSAPSVYEDGLFGIEESYPMLSLAMFGYGPDAQRYLDGTYLTREFLVKKDAYQTIEDRHQQYRNGLQPHYAVSAYRITRDAAWIRKHLPLIKDCAEWTIAQRRTTMVLEDGKRPLHWGLLPKWSYGGDIFDVQCYALYGNLCCWRALVDTAWLLNELGEQEAAKRYADEAKDYREVIDRAIDGSYQKDQRPPFLPLRLYTNKPDEQLDFYQLFAGCMLDIEPFAIGSVHLKWITDYLEDDNRMFCLLPRFRHIGPGALDAIYGKGYFLTKLHEDSIREFLLSLYAYLAFNMERDVFTSRESNVLYTADLHARSTYGVAEVSDPLPCGSAVALQLVRHMLVTEERAGTGGYTGNLMLLAGTPRAWFADGKVIRVRNAPTYFGPVDLDVRSRVAEGRIEARLTGPTRNPCGTIRLRLRHPDGKAIRSVTVNGMPHAEFDAKKEWISLPGNAKETREIIARY